MMVDIALADILTALQNAPDYVFIAKRGMVTHFAALSRPHKCAKMQHLIIISALCLPEAM